MSIVNLHISLLENGRGGPHESMMINIH